MRHRYTAEQRAYIREIAPGRYNQDIAEMFNAKYGANLTESKIKSFKANHGIRSDLPSRRRSKPRRLFTDDQEEFIIANVKWLHNQKLADLINQEFGLSITTKQIRGWKKNHGYTSNLKGSEGMPPPNKGTKGVYNVGGNKTSFKAGHTPKNHRPVGSERINVEGYVEIKTAEPNVWELKNRVVWEKKNGPIPEGHVVLFADQNKLNFDDENLILIPQSKLSILNQKGLIKNDADLTKTGLIMADIYQQISRRKKG